MSTTAMISLLKVSVSSASFAATLLALFSFGPIVEQRVMPPVVVKWTPSEVTAVGRDLHIYGTMIRQRSCEYAPPPYVEDVETGRFLSLTSNAPAPTTSWPPSAMPRPFGPWVVHEGAGKRLRFQLEHRCVPLWKYTTILGTLDRQGRLEP